MKPYYEHSGISIYHADCREWLASAPPCLRLDAMITDPPYGISLAAKANDDRLLNPGSRVASTAYADDPAAVQELIQEAIPAALGIVSRALIFPGQAMLWTYPIPRAMGCVFLPSGAGRCAWGFQCFQPILFYGKDPWLVDGKGGRPNSFRTEQPNRDPVDHPCPKPLSWMNWAVNRATRSDESILDPFCGSGTTLLAAKNLGRKAIGIEIEEKFCEIAAKRLAQEVLPFD